MLVSAEDPFYVAKLTSDILTLFIDRLIALELELDHPPSYDLAPLS